MKYIFGRFEMKQATIFLAWAEMAFLLLSFTALFSDPSIVTYFENVFLKKAAFTLAVEQLIKAISCLSLLYGISLRSAIHLQPWIILEGVEIFFCIILTPVIIIYGFVQHLLFISLIPLFLILLFKLCYIEYIISMYKAWNPKPEVQEIRVQHMIDTMQTSNYYSVI